jgi:hypothetical protein
VTEARSAPVAPAMSPRNRRLVAIGLGALVVLLFLGGIVAFFVDFRHHKVCPDGKQWISRTDQGLGRITYDCGNGVTVTQGIIP